MIKVNETGELEVYLNGKSPSVNLGLQQISFICLSLLAAIVVFFFSGALLLSVILVLCGGLLVFASFLLQNKQILHLKNGLLFISDGLIRHEDQGKSQFISHTGDKHAIKDQNGRISLLLSSEANQNIQISGFESKREAEVVIATLKGAKVNVRHKKITMRAQR